MGPDEARLERLLSQRKSRVSKLVRHSDTARPKIYGVEFKFTAGDLNSQTKAITIDRNTAFFPAKLDSSVRIIGTMPSVAYVNMTMAWSSNRTSNNLRRQEFFDFYWSLRDSGTNRDWQNAPLPSPFLLSGLVDGMPLPTRPAVKAGTQIFVTIDPIFSEDAGVTILGETFTPKSYVVYMGMVGYEEAK